MSIRKHIGTIRKHMDAVLRPHRIEEAVNALKADSLLATISAPPYAGLESLVKLAAGHGIGTSTADHAKLTLIAADSEANASPDNAIRILLLPVAKKYAGALKGLDRTQSEQAWSRHETLSRKAEDFDIVLDEAESARETLLTLIDKISLFQRLREMRQIPAPPGAERMNCFVIWGHGLKYKSEILAMIEEHFEVVAVKERNDLDITKFIREIYIEEILRVGYHIVKKNKHLLKYGGKAVLVLARGGNDAGGFTCRGHGPDRRVCSSTEEHLKQTTRDRYNPRKAGGVRSEQHVIHGSHAPLQIENTLRAFALKPLREWLEDDKDV